MELAVVVLMTIAIPIVALIDIGRAVRRALDRYRDERDTAEAELSLLRSRRWTKCPRCEYDLTDDVTP